MSVGDAYKLRATIADPAYDVSGTHTLNLRPVVSPDLRLTEIRYTARKVGT